MTDYCCDEFKKSVDNNTIIKRVDGYYIRGECDLRDDGDDLLDDLTEEYKIRFCPHCGKVLPYWGLKF